MLSENSVLVAMNPDSCGAIADPRFRQRAAALCRALAATARAGRWLPDRAEQDKDPLIHQAVIDGCVMPES